MKRLTNILTLAAVAVLAGQSSAVLAQETRTVEVNGVTRHYVDQGEGKPVVFVPTATLDFLAEH